MDARSMPNHTIRLGFHYFPDTLHYRESDLLTWLPDLKSLGASWITLVAPPDRAIPEPFLTGLLNAGIEPILHFPFPLAPNPQPDSLPLLLQTYANWGARFVVLFDRPNTRAAWPVNAWTQADLVERFLDLFIPPAETALRAGLTPVFPPLEPGGDYWDTAFLRVALQSLLRRGQKRLLESMALSAIASVGNVPLDWGAGGPERWPGARPYITPGGQQDQRGFYIFDWYLALTKAVLGAPLPMLLLRSGRRTDHSPDLVQVDRDETTHALENLALIRLIAGERVRFPIPAPWELLSASMASTLSAAQPHPQPSELEPVPAEVLTCNFWLLSSDADSPYVRDAWFQPDGSTLPVVGAARQWNNKQQAASSPTTEGQKTGAVMKSPLFFGGDIPPEPAQRSIAHYLLLPTHEGGITGWHLDAVRPFILKYRPTVGFCIEEAAHAQRVTVVGGENAFPEAAIEKLFKAGCQIERIDGDGTSIATHFASL